VLTHAWDLYSTYTGMYAHALQNAEYHNQGR